jgi:hypothetical protein
MGGDVTTASDGATGARFTVSLPLASLTGEEQRPRESFGS